MDLAYFSSNKDRKPVSFSVLTTVLLAHSALLFALASYQKPIQLPIVKPIQISLITETKPDAIEAPKPLPVQPKPVKKIVKPIPEPIKPAVTPKKPEQQLVTNTPDTTPVAAPEPRQEEPVPEVKEQVQEPVKVAEAQPKNEPAKLAYNFFARSNRVVLAELDGFAHDLFTFMSTGSRATEPTNSGNVSMLTRKEA